MSFLLLANTMNLQRCYMFNLELDREVINDNHVTICANTNFDDDTTLFIP